LAELAVRAAALLGEDTNLEGSWYGNDTVWRTCLDLQRILCYATPDGNLVPKPQRRLISITDAIIAGEREGPLAPTPISAGFVTGAMNAPAAEWVHARLMGFDPCKIPVIRHAFDSFPFPLCDFEPQAIRVRTAGREMEGIDVTSALPVAFEPPSGWKGHIELDPK
jgi:hypothetical protein